jgi:S1-C subfamily serine protease
MTASDGAFTLADVEPGDHTLLIMAGPSWEPERRQLTLAEGEVLDLGELLLRPPRVPSGSIGVSLIRERGQVLISHVTPEGPAEQAGLREGDVLLAVDGTPLVSFREALRQLDGAPSSPVVLTLRREGTEQSVSILRAP